jgi:hypothetical protein
VAWYDENWLIALATLVGAAIFYRQLRAMTRQNELDALRRVKELFPGRFEGREGRERFFDLRDRFMSVSAQAPEIAWGAPAYQRDLISRLGAVADLDPEVRAEDFAAVIPYVNALNDFADLVDFGIVDAQRVLAKYHLAIARELFIAEPYIHYKILYENSGRWGYRVLRLGEMARLYNDINPVHRRPIYLGDVDRAGDNALLVYPAPTGGVFVLLRPCWAIRRRFGYPTITERAKRRQNRQMKRIRRQLRPLTKADNRERDTSPLGLPADRPASPRRPS